MALTRISLTLLLLVGMVSATFAASDQTAELEKSNVNEDVQDVSMAFERPNQPAEMAEENEYGDVQRLRCITKFRLCIRHFGRGCYRACLFQYRVCRRLSREQDAEGRIQDVLDSPSQPAEFEEESENGDAQRRIHPYVCRRIFYICRYYFRYCIRACIFHYHLCIRGILVQDAEGSIQQKYVTPDQ